MLQGKYADFVRGLSPQELFLVTDTLRTRGHTIKKVFKTGSSLVEWCLDNKIDHYNLVMPLVKTTAPEQVSTLEHLIGHPITRVGARLPRKLTRQTPNALKTKTQKSNTSREKILAMTVTAIMEKNPKAKGSDSYVRFRLYKVGMTVAEYIEAGGKFADIKWDEPRGYISLSDPLE